MSASFATKYGNLSEIDLYRLFRKDDFEKLSAAQKLALLQEVSNRLAMKEGRQPLQVVQKNLDNRTRGYFSGKIIAINARLLKGGRFRKAIASGPELLTTILHENRHAYQQHVVDNDLPDVSENTKLKWRIANVAYLNGKQPLGDDANADLRAYCAYAMQPIESDARRTARTELERIAQMLEKADHQPDAAFRNQIDKNKSQELEIIRYTTSLLFFGDTLNVLEEAIKRDFIRVTPGHDVNERIGYFDEARFIISNRKSILDRDSSPDEILSKVDAFAFGEMKQGIDSTAIKEKPDDHKTAVRAF